MEAEPPPLQDVLQQANQPLASLLIILARRMALQVLLNGLPFPVITTQHDCLMCWRRMREVELAPAKSVVREVIEVN
jgi:hypothetical protein